MRTDVDGGNTLKLAEGAFNSECSPDGKWVLFYSTRKLYRISIDGGTPVEIFDAPNGGSSAISPDGKWIACTYPELTPVPVLKLAVIPAEGGALSTYLSGPSAPVECSGRPISKSIQYLLTREGATNVWEQPLAGGPPHPVTDFTSGHIFDFAWSRDGKELLLAKGEKTSDVLLISNFR